MNMIVAADEIPGVVVGHAGIESILPVGVGVGVTAEHRVLVILGHERLVGEYKGMVHSVVGAKPAIEPFCWSATV